MRIPMTPDLHEFRGRASPWTGRAGAGVPGGRATPFRLDATARGTPPQIGLSEDVRGPGTSHEVCVPPDDRSHARGFARNITFLGIVGHRHIPTLEAHGDLPPWTRESSSTPPPLTSSRRPSRRRSVTQTIWLTGGPLHSLETVKSVVRATRTARIGAASSPSTGSPQPTSPPSTAIWTPSIRVGSSSASAAPTGRGRSPLTAYLDAVTSVPRDRTQKTPGTRCQRTLAQ
jgi:hypothetical protein